MTVALILDKSKHLPRNPTMKQRYLYFAFAFMGLVLPYSQFVPWLMEHHVLNMSIFVGDLFANRISAFSAWT